jgi:hypothetical protein
VKTGPFKKLAIVRPPAPTNQVVQFEGSGTRYRRMSNGSAQRLTPKIRTIRWAVVLTVIGAAATWAFGLL